MGEQLELGLQSDAPPALAAIAIAEERFTPDIAGALVWPTRRTLIVADLHLEKGAACARGGTMLPPYDTRDTLSSLAEAIARHDPKRVIALGDSFHDPEVAGLLPEIELAMLHRLQRGREWLWVTGNHDPALPSRLGGDVTASLTLGGITFTHAPRRDASGPEIAGHLHPAARLAHGGASVRRKCFVADGWRLVMPAFGAYAGGLNVLDRAFLPVFAQRPFLVWMLGRSGVYPLARRQLLPD